MTVEPSAELGTYDHEDEAFNLVLGSIGVLRTLAAEIPDTTPTGGSALRNVGRLHDLLGTISSGGQAELRAGHTQLNAYIDDLMSQLDTLARALSQSGPRGASHDKVIRDFQSNLTTVKGFVSAAAQSNLGTCT